VKNNVTCLIAVLLLVGSFSAADTLVLRDGRTLEGCLLRQSEEAVVFQVIRGNIKATQTFSPEYVLVVAKGEVPVASRPVEANPEPKWEGPTYFVIPIEGSFGIEVTHELFERSLKLARVAKPTVVILEINSPGGHVDQLVKMLDTLGKHGDLRIVARPKRAISAAAFLAMACKEIVMCPGATLGACVIYQKGPAGTPLNIEEKFESIGRAMFRSASAQAGHDPLLVEGMMRTDIALGVIEKDGKPKIVRGSRGRVLKEEGRILTLSAIEAVSCGLALGVADDNEAVRELLQVPEWRESSCSCKPLWSMHRGKLDGVTARYKAMQKRGLDSYRKAVECGDSVKEIRKALRHLEQAEKCFEETARIASKHADLVGRFADPSLPQRRESAAKEFRKRLERRLPAHERRSIIVPQPRRRPPGHRVVDPS